MSPTALSYPAHQAARDSIMEYSEWDKHKACDWREIGVCPFTAGFTLIWDWGGASGSDVGSYSLGRCYKVPSVQTT